MSEADTEGDTPGEGTGGAEDAAGKGRTARPTRPYPSGDRLPRARLPRVGHPGSGHPPVVTGTARDRRGGLAPRATRSNALHPGAWWLWALGLGTAASRTTNPL